MRATWAFPFCSRTSTASIWDFTIENGGEKETAIRFGFSAVKNVGEAPVNLILEARKDKPFKDLNDFARRVDLRAVGKRALECLVKVGALDNFGNRAALLASLDRIVGVSNSHFQAVRAGQMSLFGAETGITENITLPEVNDVDQREMLNWERDLIGLYLSDHPLSSYQKQLSQIVTYFSGQLPEAQHEEKVRVAGLVTNIRPYQTKAGKPMGFVTLEDIQGVIDLVMFPRTWKQYLRHSGRRRDHHRRRQGGRQQQPAQNSGGQRATQITNSKSLRMRLAPRLLPSRSIAPVIKTDPCPRRTPAPQVAELSNRLIRSPPRIYGGD